MRKSTFGASSPVKTTDILVSPAAITSAASTCAKIASFTAVGSFVAII